ncbi:Rrf2 family transcriptional regulator [Cyanobacteria bacterium FACHB-471]|nr:Rrf2 family transcriptional regulator [Cyanobacteria bacterium FACHB-471]
MELSAKVEYALIALLEMASHPQPGEPLQIKHIAAKQSIPDRYLEQVFAALRHAGIVRSQRGNKGGYLLAREPWQITLLEIFNCLEDNSRSAQGKTVNCDRVIVRNVWKEAEQSARAVLQRHTLRDLCQQREIRQRLSGMYYI